jgi:CRP/FNR family transcriptional regulator, cyclic AMP receptor protein
MTTADYIAVFRGKSDENQPRVSLDSLTLPGWSDADWGKLLAHITPRKYRESEVVIQRGAVDRALYFVAAGALEVGVTHVDGVSISPLARVGAGSVIGEQSFFDGQPRSANIWAVRDGELLQLGFEEFQKFSAAEPVLARDLLFTLGCVLSSRLRNTTYRVRR